MLRNFYRSRRPVIWSYSFGDFLQLSQIFSLGVVFVQILFTVMFAACVGTGGGGGFHWRPNKIFNLRRCRFYSTATRLSTTSSKFTGITLWHQYIHKYSHTQMWNRFWCCSRCFVLSNEHVFVVVAQFPMKYGRCLAVLRRVLLPNRVPVWVCVGVNTWKGVVGGCLDIYVYIVHDHAWLTPAWRGIKHIFIKLTE